MPKTRFSIVRDALKAAGALARSRNCLLAFLLLLQLIGAGQPSGPRRDPASGALDIAGLGAAIGTAVPLCRHGDPGDPSPAPDDCAHCVLCGLVGLDIALLPRAETVPTRRGEIVAMAPPRRLDFAAHPPYPGNASPRGPPNLI